MSNDYLKKLADIRINRRQKNLKRIRGLSEKRQQQYKQWPAVRDRYLADHPFCEWPGCPKRAIDVHHTEGKEGERLLDPTKLKALCRRHHRWCKEKPELAEKNGMIKSRLT